MNEFDWNKGTPVTAQPSGAAVSVSQNGSDSFDWNSGTPVNQVQKQTAPAGTKFTGKKDEETYYRKQALYNRINEGQRQADPNWLEQASVGTARTALDIGVGLGQLGTSALSLIDRDIRNPESSSYNPLYDPKSASAKLFQAEMAKGQTPWEKVGKTIGDVFTIAAPELLASKAKLAGTAATLPQKVAGIAAGSSDTFAPYVTKLLQQPGLNKMGLVNQFGKLTTGGNLLNNLIADAVGGVVYDATRSGETNPWDSIKGAGMTAGVRAGLGMLGKLSSSTEENVLNQIQKNPETVDKAVNSLKGFVMKAISGKRSNVGSTLKALGLDVGQEQKFDDVIEQLALEGNIPKSVKGLWDTTENMILSDKLLEQHGRQIGAIYDSIKVPVDTVDLYEAMLKDIQGDVQYKNYMAGGGDKDLSKNLLGFLDEQIANLNILNGRPANASPTLSDLYTIAKNYEQGLYKPNFKGEFKDSVTLADQIHAGALRRAVGSIADKYILQEFGTELGQSVVEARQIANANWQNEKIIRTMLEKMNGKVSPYALSQSFAHLIGLGAGAASGIAGFNNGPLGAAGMGSLGYLGGKVLSQTFGNDVADIITNNKLSGNIINNLPNLSTIPGGIGSSRLASMLKRQTKNNLLDGVTKRSKK